MAILLLLPGYATDSKHGLHRFDPSKVPGRQVDGHGHQTPLDDVSKKKVNAKLAFNLGQLRSGTQYFAIG